MDLSRIHTWREGQPRREQLNDELDKIWSWIATIDPDAFLLSGRPAGQAGYGSTVTAGDLELHSNPLEDGQLILGIVTIDEATGMVGINFATPSADLHIRGVGDRGIKIETTGANRAYINLQTVAQVWRFLVAPTTPTFNVTDATAGTIPLRILQACPNDTLRITPTGVFLALSGSAPTTPTNGIFLSPEDVAAKSELFVYNEASERVRLTGLDARTTADFSKTDATLADVTGLFRNVEAGKSYSFVFRLYDQMSALGGYALQLNGTCTATNLIAHFHRHPVASTLFSMSNSVTSLGHTAVGEATPASASGYIECRGTIEVNAAGTFGIKFAQNSASGTSTIKRGSTLHLREIT